MHKIITDETVVSIVQTWFQFLDCGARHGPGMVLEPHVVL